MEDPQFCWFTNNFSTRKESKDFAFIGRILQSLEYSFCCSSAFCSFSPPQMPVLGGRSRVTKMSAGPPDSAVLHELLSQQEFSWWQNLTPSNSGLGMLVLGTYWSFLAEVGCKGYLHPHAGSHIARPWGYHATWALGWRKGQDCSSLLRGRYCWRHPWKYSVNFTKYLKLRNKIQVERVNPASELLSETNTL